MVTSLSSFGLKGPSVIILLIGAVLALSFLDTCHAAGNTTNKEAKSMEKGMDFLFLMTKGFLGFIQPNKIYEKFDLEKLANSKDYREDTLRDWKKISLYLIGYAICAAIGIVFIIIMPIVGCCLCCCRTCCDNCGGKLRKTDPKGARYKRGCYATFLTIFNTFILFAVVCTFVTNELYKKRFIDDPEIINVARSGTKDLMKFVDNSFTDLKTVATKEVSLLEKTLLSQLKNAGNTTVTKFSNLVNVTDVLNQVKVLGNGVIKLNGSISLLSATLQDLNNTGTTLENELEKVKNDVTKKLKACGQPDCNQIKDYLKKTSVNTQFSKLDRQTTLLDKLKDLLDIPDMAKQAEEKFNSVSKNISDVINEHNTTIANGFNKVSKELDSSLNFSSIKDGIPSKTIDNELNKALDLFKSNETNSSIPWYIGLCVASILLLIVVCNYLGILFGLCGERAGDNTPCCNRGVAANFLLAGVGFYFIFCWILMILVLIEFLVGGIIYTEICRYLNKNDPTQIKPILLNFNFTYKMFDEDHVLVTYDVVDKCYKNNSVLNAISFPKKTLMNKIPTQKLLDEINKIDPNKISIGKVKLMDSTLETKLKDFVSLDTNSINLTQYEVQLNELKKTVLTTDLNVIASNLTALSSLANITFEAEANALRNIMNTTYVKMKSEMATLGKTLSDVKKDMNLGESVNATISKILDIEKKVNDEGNKLVMEIVKNETKNLVIIVKSHLEKIIDIVINEIAPCRPVYDLFFTFTDIVCVTFLNPTNGFWFSTGWAIFFFLPTIIFATKLAGLYRCWYKRDLTQENADSFTAGDADNIPLARVNQGKSSPQGMPNSAYDEISSNKYNPPPNHQQYNYGGPGHHYSGYPVYPPPSYHDTRMNPARF